MRSGIYTERTFGGGVLVRFGVPAHQRDEMTQEVMYQALRSLPAFRGDASVRTWLYGIARNVARQHRRKRQREVLVQPQDVHALDRNRNHDHRAPLPGPFETLVRTNRKALIERALDHLPTHYAEIIRLRDLDEQSTAETATALGLSRSNTRVRLHRARKALRDLLRPYLAHR